MRIQHFRRQDGRCIYCGDLMWEPTLETFQALAAHFVKQGSGSTRALFLWPPEDNEGEIAPGFSDGWYTEWFCAT